MKKSIILIAMVFSMLSLSAKNYEGAVRLNTERSIPTLEQDGKPLLLIGGQFHNSNATSYEYVKGIIDKAKQLEYNCVWLPVEWDLIEPEEGKFDFTTVSDILKVASEYDMRLVILWFASWKNGESSYAPAWVKKDVNRFPRAKDANGYNGIKKVTLSPFGKETVKADSKAFAKLMEYIRDNDTKRLVAAMQIENEVGVFDDMDHCEEAVRLLKSKYLKKYPNEAEAKQALMAAAYAKYVNTVAVAGKKVYDIPMYANAWLKDDGTLFGEYPNGGPRASVIDVWKQYAPALDWVSPDIYRTEYRRIMSQFTRPDNPLFIPETNLTWGQAYLAFGEFGAMGFSPFGFEECDDRYFQEEAKVLIELQDVILAHREKGETHGFMREEKDAPDGTVNFEMGDWKFNINYIPAEKNAHGMIIRTAPDEFIVAGIGAWMTFESLNPGMIAKVLMAEEIYKDNGEWKTMTVMNGDETENDNVLYLRGRLDGLYRPSFARRNAEKWVNKFKVSGIYRIKLYTYPEK